MKKRIEKPLKKVKHVWEKIILKKIRLIWKMKK